MSEFSRTIDIDAEPVGGERRRSDRQEHRIRAAFWRTARRAAQAIPFMEDVVAGYYCAFDPATPRRVRLILVGALAYFVLPTDVMPDFLPLVGFTDDVTVLLTALGTVAGHITPTHRAAARAALVGDGGGAKAE
jgi:uncharacterized membrane protein YkvA (DUF1232 family)